MRIIDARALGNLVCWRRRLLTAECSIFLFNLHSLVALHEQAAVKAEFLTSGDSAPKQAGTKNAATFASSKRQDLIMLFQKRFQEPCRGSLPQKSLVSGGASLKAGGLSKHLG